MANVKITGLTAITAPANTDVLPIVDVSADVTKKVSVADLLESAGDGTAALPAFAFDSDKDIGMYRVGANQLGFATAGTSRIVVDASGNVGIGTTPSNELSTGYNLRLNGGSQTFIAINNSTHTTQATGGLVIGNDSSSAYIIQRENQPIGIYTNNAEAMRVDSSGRLLVGKTSSSANNAAVQIATLTGAALQVQCTQAGGAYALFQNTVTGDATSDGLYVGTDGDLDGYFWNYEAADLYFGTNNLQRAQIDSNGNLLVGLNQARTGFFNTNAITPRLQVETSGPTDSGRFMSLVSNPGASAGYVPTFLFGKSRSATASGVTGVANNDALGAISFQGADGSHLVEAARIDSFVDGTTGTDDIPGRLAFHTTADGASAPTERLRIDSSGNVRIGQTSGSSSKLSVYGSQLRFQGASTGTGESDGFGIGNNGSTDPFIWNYENGFIQFGTDNTERMRIDAGGDVAIGMAPAGKSLSIQHAANPTLGFYTGSTLRGELNITTGETSLRSYANSPITFEIGNERMRIKSNGNVGINQTDPDTKLDVNGAFFLRPTTETFPDENGAGLRLRSDTNRLQLRGLQWTPSVVYYDIDYLGLEHEWSVNGSPKMKLDSSGRMLLGLSSTSSSGARLQIQHATNSPGLTLQTTVNSGSYMLFQNPTSGFTTGRGLYVGGDSAGGGYLWNYEAGLLNLATSGLSRLTISVGGKLTAPGVYSGTTTGGGPVYVESDGDLLRYTSSLKYKTDIETIEDSRADAILNCRPVWYRSKCANDIKTEGAEKSDWGWYGFIAEELAEIEPRLVNWATKDAVFQEDGKTKSVERDPANYEAEGVRYENFVPLLVNLAKRQQAAIETLQAKVAALEAG